MNLLLSVIAALNFICIAFAVDEAPMQDLCVAELNSKTVRVNGWPCKDLNNVTVLDFVYRGFHMPGFQIGPSFFRPVDVTTFPGLNTQGLSLLRFDLLNKSSQIAPHTHPRASELIIVTQGAIEAGFASGQKQYNTKLTRGDLFVFPQGLVHYFRNSLTTRSIVTAVFDSQLPGFATNPVQLYGD